jgi:hypothetical protein
MSHKVKALSKSVNYISCDEGEHLRYINRYHFFNYLDQISILECVDYLNLKTIPKEQFKYS